MGVANDNYVNSPHPAANMEDLEVNNEDLDDSFVATTAPTHGLQDVDGVKEDASHKLSPHGNLIYGSGSKVDPFQVPVDVGPSDNISTHLYRLYCHPGLHITSQRRRELENGCHQKFSNPHIWRTKAANGLSDL
jgi:hypothetical protein